MIRNIKDIKKFFESIFCIKNEGIYKVIEFFGIKIRIKRYKNRTQPGRENISVKVEG
jgi:hypothetical protein